MKTWCAVGAIGTVLLLAGWWLSPSWPAAIAGGVGMIGVLGALVRRDWTAPPTLVGLAVVAQVALPRRPEWALVVLVTVLLALFLALGEMHQNRLGTGRWSVASGPHLVPIGACVAAALLVACVYLAPTVAVAAELAVGIGAAGCAVLLLLVAHSSPD